MDASFGATRSFRKPSGIRGPRVGVHLAPSSASAANERKAATPAPAPLQGRGLYDVLRVHFERPARGTPQNS